MSESPDRYILTIGAYTVFSVEAGLSPSAVRVATVLLARFNWLHQQAYPTRSTIAADSKLSVGTVSKALAEIEAQGILTIEKLGKSRRNIYRFDWPKIEELYAQFLSRTGLVGKSKNIGEANCVDRSPNGHHKGVETDTLTYGNIPNKNKTKREKHPSRLGQAYIQKGLKQRELIKKQQQDSAKTAVNEAHEELPEIVREEIDEFIRQEDWQKAYEMEIRNPGKGIVRLQELLDFRKKSRSAKTRGSKQS